MRQLQLSRQVGDLGEGAVLARGIESLQLDARAGAYGISDADRTAVERT